MSTKGVAVIVAPNETIHHGIEHVASFTEEDGGEAQARQTLMNAFAKTVLGPNFVNVSPEDAWQFWRIAEKNGFRIQIIGREGILLKRLSN